MNKKYLLEVHEKARKLGDIRAMFDIVAFASSHKIKLKGK